MTRDQLISRIHALAKMTIASGCTEHEAATAQAMLHRLMSEHQIHATELGIRTRANECTRDYFVVLDTRFPDHFFLAPIIAKLYSCKTWGTHGTEELDPDLGMTLQSKRLYFFGLPEDVAACLALAQIIATATSTESARFAQATPSRLKLKSFRKGLLDRLGERLADLLRRPPTGPGLVLVKTELVQTEFAKLGLSLRNTRPGTTPSDPTSYYQGRTQAESVRLGHHTELSPGQVKIARAAP